MNSLEASALAFPWGQRSLICSWTVNNFDSRRKRKKNWLNQLLRPGYDTNTATSRASHYCAAEILNTSHCWCISVTAQHTIRKKTAGAITQWLYTMSFWVWLLMESQRKWLLWLWWGARGGGEECRLSDWYVIFISLSVPSRTLSLSLSVFRALSFKPLEDISFHMIKLFASGSSIQAKREIPCLASHLSFPPLTLGSLCPQLLHLHSLIPTL